MKPARCLLVFLLAAAPACEPETTTEARTFHDARAVPGGQPCPSAADVFLEIREGSDVRPAYNPGKSCHVSAYTAVSFLEERVGVVDSCCFLLDSACVDLSGQPPSRFVLDAILCLDPAHGTCPTLEAARPQLTTNITASLRCDDPTALRGPVLPATKQCLYDVSVDVECEASHRRTHHHSWDD